MIDKSISENRNHGHTYSSPPRLRQKTAPAGKPYLSLPLLAAPPLRSPPPRTFFTQPFPGPFQMIVSAMAIIRMIAEDVLDIW